MNFSKQETIAIIDSGIGGVSVLKQLVKKFGGGNYIYYADNEFMPYGNKSKEQINKRIENIINYLFKTYKVSKVIIACNTASTCYNNNLKNVFPMKFYKNKTYYATRLTKKNLTEFNVISDGSLPKEIENNIFNKDLINKIVKAHIKEHKLMKHNEIVLGCTHYELVANVFKIHAPKTKFILNSENALKELKSNISSELNIWLLMSKYSKSYSDKFYKLLNYLNIKHTISSC